MTYPKTWGDVGSSEHGVAENKLRTAGQTMGDQPFYRVTTMGAEGQKLAGRDEIFIPPTGQPPTLSGVWGSPAQGALQVGGSEAGHNVIAPEGRLYTFTERGSLKEKTLPPSSRLQDMAYRADNDKDLLNGVAKLNTLTVQVPKGFRGDDIIDWDTDPPRTTYPVNARYIDHDIKILSAVNVKDGYWRYSELPVSISQTYGRASVSGGAYITGGLADYRRLGRYGTVTLATSYKFRSQSYCVFSTRKSAEKDEYGFNDIRPQFNYLRNGNMIINGRSAEAVFAAELPAQGGGTGRNFTDAATVRLSGGDALGLFFEYVRRSESAAGNGSGWVYRVTSDGVAMPAVELQLPVSYKGLEFDAPLFDNPYLTPVSQYFTGNIRKNSYPGIATKEVSEPYDEEWISSGRSRNAALDFASAYANAFAFDNNRALFAFLLPAVWAGWIDSPSNADYIVNPYTYYVSTSSGEAPIIKPVGDADFYSRTCRTLFYLYDNGSVSQIEFPLWTANAAVFGSSLKLADNTFMVSAWEVPPWSWSDTFGCALHLFLTTDNGDTWSEFPTTGLPRANRTRVYDGDPSVLKFKKGNATEIGITASDGVMIHLYTFMPEYDSNGILKTDNVKWKKRQTLYKTAPYVAFEVSRSPNRRTTQPLGYEQSPPGRTGYVGTYFQRYIGYDRKRYGRDPLVQLPEYFNP